MTSATRRPDLSDIRSESEDQRETAKIMSGLSDKEKEIIKSTFKIFYSSDPVKNGMGVFLRMLQEYPEYKKLWPTFKHVHDSHLMGAAEIKAHTNVYMHGLKRVIHDIDDDVALTKQLKSVAKVHLAQGITKNHVLHMCPALLAALKSCLDDDYNEEVVKAWTTLFGIIATLVEQYKFIKI